MGLPFYREEKWHLRTAFVRFLVNTTELKDKVDRLSTEQFGKLYAGTCIEHTDEGGEVTVTLRYKRPRPAVLSGNTKGPALSFPDPPEDGTPEL